MKNIRKAVFLAITSLLVFTQCSVAKYTPDKLPTKQIIFGSGGGFINTETAYTLLENGQIFKQVGTEKTYKELKAIKKKEAKGYFEKVASLQLYKMDIEKPGNLYYFLQEVNEMIDSRVTWGAGDYLPPQGIITVYKELHSMAKDQEVVREGKKAASELPEEKDKSKDDKTGW